MLGITHSPWLAYCFDDAVSLFGGWVEANRFEYTEKGERVDKIHSLLDVPKPMVPLNPEPMVGRRIVKVPRD